MCDAFVSAFEDFGENEKEKFILEIKEINSLEEKSREEFIKSTCRKFASNFLTFTLQHSSDEELSDSSDFTNEDLCKNISSHIAKVKYFGMPLDCSADAIMKSGSVLRDGRIYQLPNGVHNWLNNLSWLLAHIHKKNSFVVFSKLTVDALYRKSEGHSSDLSGFAREIALLTKLKYKLHLEGSTLKLLPPEDTSEIENLHVKNSYLSEEEVIAYYNQAVEMYENLMSSQNILR